MTRIRFWGAVWSIEAVIAILNGEIGAALFGTNVPFFLLALLAAAVAILGLVYGVFHAVIRRTRSPFLWLVANVLVTPALIIGAVALIPDGTIVDVFRGTPGVRAFYEGTQCGAKATFRSNGAFDVYFWGWPGTAEYYRGTYREDEGEFICTYTGRRLDRWTDRVYRDARSLVFESAEEGRHDSRFQIEYESDERKR